MTLKIHGNFMPEGINWLVLVIDLQCFLGGEKLTLNIKKNNYLLQRFKKLTNKHTTTSQTTNKLTDKLSSSVRRYVAGES